MKQKIKILIIVLPYFLLILYFVYPQAFSIFRGIRIETVSDMQEQNKITSQEPDSFFHDSASMRPSPIHSIPVGNQRFPYEQVEYDSSETLINPLPVDDYVLARGRNRFEIFCVPCHGEDGKGNGLIITKPQLTEDEEGFPPPADLTSEHTARLSDGRIFHILSAGKNLMFRVNFKMNKNDRWALVHYIRKLENMNKKKNPNE